MVKYQIKIGNFIISILNIILNKNNNYNFFQNYYFIHVL